MEGSDEIDEEELDEALQRVGDKEAMVGSTFSNSFEEGAGACTSSTTFDQKFRTPTWLGCEQNGS